MCLDEGKIKAMTILDKREFSFENIIGYLCVCMCI